ncbi:hypothetical protein [Alkalimarinus alittae]|uniref:Uncharacterized protein n=1 Tax=Alkalimarinus alittae TaxID=2961619 RepID=A0ABY6MXV4_9ALTE|nr:hypothetical protein [Alkalimarinus alittae]UZE94612.1 hypothetical protein NKI27_10985 [Alkalimarinus alittae]
MLPQLINNPSHLDDNVVSHVSCLLNKGECTYQSLTYGELTLSVTPNNFKALIPLTVTLTTNNPNITRSFVSLDGKDMYMGLNQSELTQSGGKGHWKGVITIPVCTVDAEMAWLFSVTLQGLETERLVFNIKSKH